MGSSFPTPPPKSFRLPFMLAMSLIVTSSLIHANTKIPVWSKVNSKAFYGLVRELAFMNLLHPSIFTYTCCETRCINMSELTMSSTQDLLHHSFISSNSHATHSISSSSPHHTKGLAQCSLSSFIINDTSSDIVVVDPSKDGPRQFKRSDSLFGSSVEPSSMSPRLENNFEVLEKVGHGGFGEVFKVQEMLTI